MDQKTCSVSRHREVGIVQLALDRRLGAVDKDLGAHVGTERAGKLATLGTNLSRLDSGGGLERFGVSVRAELCGAFHELCPDRQCGTGAFQPLFAVVVKAYPNHAQQLAGEAGEPSVVGGSGFTCCRKCEATGTDSGAGSATARHPASCLPKGM